MTEEKREAAPDASPTVSAEQRIAALEAAFLEQQKLIERMTSRGRKHDVEELWPPKKATPRNPKCTFGVRHPTPTGDAKTTTTVAQARKPSPCSTRCSSGNPMTAPPVDARALATLKGDLLREREQAVRLRAQLASLQQRNKDALLDRDREIRALRQEVTRLKAAALSVHRPAPTHAGRAVDRGEGPSRRIRSAPAKMGNPREKKPTAPANKRNSRVANSDGISTSSPKVFHDQPCEEVPTCRPADTPSAGTTEVTSRNPVEQFVVPNRRVDEEAIPRRLLPEPIRAHHVVPIDTSDGRRSFVGYVHPSWLYLVPLELAGDQAQHPGTAAWCRVSQCPQLASPFPSLVDVEGCSCYGYVLSTTTSSDTTALQRPLTLPQYCLLRAESGGLLHLSDMGRILLQLFLAVLKLHGVECAHGCINPQTVFCVECGDGHPSVIIAGYGCDAKSLQDKLYCTPEGFAPSAAADVWCCGVVAWELFQYCMQPPYAQIPPSQLEMCIRQQGLQLSCPSNCPIDVFDTVVAPCFTMGNKQQTAACAIEAVRKLTCLVKECTEGGGMTPK